MKERPILFSGEMVRAILEGRKTQTRRILKQALSPSTEADIDGEGVAKISRLYGDGPGHDVHEHVSRVRCAYGVPGDRLWVRETFSQVFQGRVFYRANPGDIAMRWTPSIHIPRALSRIDLEVTAVRVERLHEITEDDARAEGVHPEKTKLISDEQPIIAGDGRTKGSHPHTFAFACLWDDINNERASWMSNPWVWVVSFERRRP